MKYKDLEEEFLKFKNIHKDKTFSKLSEFFNSFRIIFEKEKISEHKTLGFNENVSQQKTRQSWVSFLGSSLEKIILILIKDFCTKNNLKITTDKILKSNNLNQELDLVKRALLVHFNEYSFLPDADLVIYKIIENNAKIYCILSIKNSFRERYTKTPYWKLKLLQNKNTENIKVFMITQDNDDEISFIKNEKPRKLRIVLDYELDGIYLVREKFDISNKIKNINELEKDIIKIIK